MLVSSVLGRFGVPGYGAYCAAKHGLSAWPRPWPWSSSTGASW
ncbi:MAG: hypothetical protein IPO28_15010 [Holophagaceae bacterium]|nr:hypothetical protein [Holophagaceae bacterium]